ncbi:MAG: hypothetical protein HYT75_05340 [Deltaproteobacteria bacterium]|nr:hypothetical protein [Deltaproteobacteria bacterium]
MAINNSHKPISSGARQSEQQKVGATYGERRQNFTNTIGHTEATNQRSKYSFGREEKVNEKAVEVFSSNAEFVGGKLFSHQKAVKNLEAGAKARPHNISDDMRLAYLDKIIGAAPKNKAETQAKTPVNSRTKLIKA